MRFVFPSSFLLFCLLLLLPKNAIATGSLYCGVTAGKILCTAVTDSGPTAGDQARKFCNERAQGCVPVGASETFNKTCISVAAPVGSTRWTNQSAATEAQAREAALTLCHNFNLSAVCEDLITACDTKTPTIAAAPPPPILPAIPRPITSSSTFSYIMSALFSLFNLGAVGTGISFGIGLIIALFIYAKRELIANVLIHDRLPYKLPVYGEAIQVLFKRTQRVNWYGRVIFGVAVTLVMSEHQLSDTRKYWLGRVIAFDSLRRQRQNELARMHLQLAAVAKPESKEKTALRQLWAAIKYVLFVLFYLARAVFSFLFGFLFIRVTIAKLARGTKVESKDLILVLQAKTAIEETATYLKEYLATANSFDGTDEVHDA